MSNTSKLLIHKYKPLTLSDFYFPIKFKQTLENFIKISFLNILFVGSTGSGKTSLINTIISQYYNNNKLINDNNILNINMLKDQGISYYRNELKTFCQTKCVEKNKKKFVIIDDFDLIHPHSQQVFRHFIDKYSKNVFFLGSCTNIQKVITCFQSRTNIINLENLTQTQLFNITKNICLNESLDINDINIKKLIKMSNNSIQIIINSLQKLILLNSNDINKINTNISFCELEAFTVLLKNNNINEAIKILINFIQKGFSVLDILDLYFTFIKNTDIITDVLKYKVVPIICKYIIIFNDVHEDYIELVFFANDVANIFYKCLNT